VAVGDGDFDGVQLRESFVFIARVISAAKTGGPFNDVKYSLGLFNGEPSYFTGSEDVEIRG
jgi:hypothetical protein